VSVLGFKWTRGIEECNWNIELKDTRNSRLLSGGGGAKPVNNVGTNLPVGQTHCYVTSNVPQKKELLLAKVFATEMREGYREKKKKMKY